MNKTRDTYFGLLSFKLLCMCINKLLFMSSFSTYAKVFLRNPFPWFAPLKNSLVISSKKIPNPTISIKYLKKSSSSIYRLKKCILCYKIAIDNGEPVELVWGCSPEGESASTPGVSHGPYLNSRWTTISPDQKRVYT